MTLETQADPAAVARELAADLIDPCDAVLVRVWLVGPGDQCTSCAMRPECADQTRCLHLVASAGANTRLDGPFRRFPIGARRVGQVASTREPFLASEDLPGSGLAEPAWLATHQVRSFAAFPLVLGDELLGVLALFSRRVIADAHARTLAVAVRHAALALAGARAHAAAAPAYEPAPASRPVQAPRSASAPTRRARPAPPPAPTPATADLRTLAEIEREAIERVLLHTGGRVSGPAGAARILGLKPTTLQSRMLKLGVRRVRVSTRETRA